MAKNAWGDDVAVAEDPRASGDKPAAQLDLPAGVKPSTAGAGRGRAIPPSPPLSLAQARPMQAQAAPSQETETFTDPMTGAAMGEAPRDARAATPLTDAKRTQYPGRVLDKDIPAMSLGSVAQDTLSGALQIIPTAAKGVGEVVRLATGDYLGKGLTDYAQRSIDAARWAAESDRGAAQRKKFQQDMQDPQVNAAQVLVGNPGALADMVLPTVGSMALPIGAAGVAGKVASAGNAAKLAAAIDPATMAARVAAAQGAASLGTTVAQNAASGYSESRDSGLPQDQAYLRAAITAPFTYVASRLTGGGAEGQAGRALFGKQAVAGGARGTLAATGKEAGQEAGEAVGEYVGETVGRGEEFDLNKAAKQVAVGATLGAVVGGGANVLTARIQKLKDAGETKTASLLERRAAAESVDTEIGNLGEAAAHPKFQEAYRAQRTAGLKPVEAAARAAMVTAFGEMGATAGLSDRAIAAAREKATKLPLDKVPDFLERYSAGLAARKLGQALPPGSMAETIAALREDAMGAALDKLYADTPAATVNAIRDLEASSAKTQQLESITDAMVVGSDSNSDGAQGLALTKQFNSAALVPLDLAEGGGADASLGKGAGKSAVTYSQGNSNLASADTLLGHGLRSLDVPTQKTMLRSMFAAAGDNDQVIRGIVQSIPIAMVNNLTGQQFTSNDSLSNQPVLVNALRSALGLNVGSGAVDSLESDPAGMTTEVVLPNAMARSTTDAGSAVVANYGDRHAVKFPTNEARNQVIAIEPLGDLPTIARNASNDPNRTPGADSEAAPAPDQAPEATGSAGLGQAAAGADARAGEVEAAWLNSPPPLENIAASAMNSVADGATVKESLQVEKPQLGRNNIPLAEGGKPFKTKLAAETERKGQTMMRVVRVPGGFALANKTEAQLAAQAKAAQRLSNPSTSGKGEPIPAHAFIAAQGGMSPEAMADTGFDRNVRIGNRTLFAAAGKGLTLEQATEKLVQDGYLPEGASHSDTINLVSRSVQSPQYTPEGFARLAEAEAATRYEDHLAAQQDAELAPDGVPENDMESSGYDAASPEIQAEVRALIDLAESKGIDTEAIREDAARQTTDQPEQAYYENTRSALADAITRSDAASRTTPAGEGRAGLADQTINPSDGNSRALPGKQGNSGVNSSLAQEFITSAATNSIAPESFKLNTDGTLLAPADAADALKAGGITRTMNGKNGILVGKTQAQRAMEILNGNSIIPSDGKAQPTPDKPEQLSKQKQKDKAAEPAQQAAADLKAALADLADLLTKGTRMNMLPEQEVKLLPVLTRLFDAAFRLGHIKFKDAARFALDQIRTALGQDVADQITIEHLQGAYIGISGKYRSQGADSARDVVGVESKDEIDAATPQERTNAASTRQAVERDSPVPAAQPEVVQAVPDGPRPAAKGPGRDGGQPESPGRGRQDDSGVSTGGPVVVGERGDQRLPGGNPAAQLESGPTGALFGEGGGDSGISGVPPDAITASQVASASHAGNAELKRRAEQRAANAVPIKPGLENIRATLTYLLEGQQQDVQTAETRFAKPDGYGMLFTNGTGTGKTFSGLGIVKRFERAGKTNTLIVVPDEKIASDWIKAGEPLQLIITKLADTKTAGEGIVVTTYANLGANDALAKRDWDLVVADEAHTLMQEASGKPTLYLDALRAITHHPDGRGARHTKLHRPLTERYSAAEKQLRELSDRRSKSSDTRERINLAEEIRKAESAIKPLRQEYSRTLDEVAAEVKAKQGRPRARAVFLSATPFAYEKTIDWANGYLFDYGPPSDSSEYNAPDPRQRFFMTHLGYRMRMGKLTEPEANVDRGLMQRQFNGWMKKEGVLSGRMLDVAADYDRRFVLVDSAIGTRIDEALDWLSDNSYGDQKIEGMSDVRAAVDDNFDYLSRRYLLEAIKAQEVVPIVKQHMAMGRKVVVFHDYNKGGGFNPFNVPPAKVAGPEKESAARAAAYQKAAAQFRTKFADLVQADFAAMGSPIDTFKAAFGKELLLINGLEKKGDVLRAYNQIQNDASGPLVALVQADKNKGWSGHDTTGKHQRVLINLGQPTQPTRSIQQEGRIYRTGQVSNAVFRYLNTGTNWERWAFATTIAGRASTAENLGMGELARSLKDAYIAAFEESGRFPPGHPGEGTGGKERDKAANNALTEYDRARAFYFGTQKKTSQNKAQEGTDYFATPEPVGYKMAQWAGVRGGEDVLEPSGGHGAIARWFPELANRVAIEPSSALRARLAMVFDGKIIESTFEAHNVINKYHAVVMNPPFGTGGKMAVDHLAKAASHVRDGGRIVALLPTGPSADKRLNDFLYGDDKRAKDLFMLAEVTLPKVTFERAGTQVATKIIVLQKGGDAGTTRKIDLSDAENINELFDRLEEFNIEPRGQAEAADSAPMRQTTPVMGTSAARQQAIDAATESAKKALANGGSNQDAMRAATDELIGRMAGAPDIAIATDGPAAVKAATSTPVKNQPPVQAGPAQAATENVAKRPEVARATEKAPAAKPRTDLVEVTTAKGKVLRGVIRKDLSLAQAKEIDPYTWKPKGYDGFFIREKYLAGEPAAAEPAATPESADLTFSKRGDFWNYSGEAASRVSQALGVTLTQRNGVPMVGFPTYALERSKQALLEAGISASFNEPAGTTAPTLTAPTPADVLAQQERAKDGDRAEREASQAAERKATADAQRNEFTLTGSDRAADVAAAGGQKPMFSRGPLDKPDGLAAFAQADDLFALPLSKAKDLEQIARDNGEEVKIRTTKLGSEMMHTLTFKNGSVIRITDRPPSPYGQHTQIYAMELEDGDITVTQKGRPGENPEDVPPTEDVWLDVSENTPASLGSKAYSIAATYALNNGKIFIGDPNGLTGKALRRRTEQMLSHALKSGTTKHLAPHPKQVAGNGSLGVPPLKWVYGDHVGNVERMIDVSLQSLENGAPGAKDDTRYNPDTGEFTDKSGQVVPRKSSMGRDMAAYRAGVNQAQAGWRTLARAAFLRSFLGPNGRAEGSGILDRAGGNVSRLQRNAAGEGPYSPTERIFYSRTGDKSGGLSETDGLRAVSAFHTQGLRKLKMVRTIEQLPESGKARIKSEGVTGVRGLYDPATDTTYLVRENLSSLDEALFVGLHESFHRGLRKSFGPEVAPILTLIDKGNERVSEAATQYMKTYGIGRLEAVEEVLADMAGQGIAGDLKGWDKLLAFLRDAIGKIASKLGVTVKFTDQQITDMVAGIRRAGMQDVHLDGKDSPVVGDSTPQTETPAFRAWFKDSKVVNPDGSPMVVYHGTFSNNVIDAFDIEKGNGMVWMTSQPSYAGEFMGRSSGAVYPLYASIKKPFDASRFTGEKSIKYWKQKLHEGGVDISKIDWSIVDFAPEYGSKYNFYDLFPHAGNNEAKSGALEAMQSAGFDGLISPAEEGMSKKGGVNYVAFKPEQIKSAIGNNGNFDPTNPDIRFARTAPTWDAPEPTRMDKLIYEMQNNRIDLKRVQEAIKAGGNTIGQKFDAVLAETLYPGRVARRSEQFLDIEVKPLMEAMAKNGATTTELADYLIARHAPERNAQVAKVNPALQDGGAGKNSQGVLMTDAAAAAHLAALSPAKRMLLDMLARKVDAITTGTRKLLVAEGLEKADTVAAWEGAYKNYVPLFKDEAEHSHPQGMGFTVKGSSAKRSTGSTKEVTNVLAHVLMQREAAITRAEKNRVGLALYGLALSNPNPAFWTTIKPTTDAATIAAQLQAMGVNPAAMGDMDGVPTIRTVDPLTNKVVDRPNPMYKSLPGAITLKVEGEDRVLMLNEKDPRALRMAMSLKNQDRLVNFDLAGSKVGQATRWLAAVNTQYNPAFGLVNLVRDTLGGTVNLGSTQLRGKSMLVLAQVPAAMQGIARELAGGGVNSEWSKLWKQFQDDGGKTGYRDMFMMAEDRAKEIERELQQAANAGKLTPGKVAHGALDLLDGFNTTLENAVRLSAYKTALDNGISRPEAARLARELTVDFNRKGRTGRELGPLYAFLNASVQGTARTVQTLKGPTGAKIIAGGLALGAIQALMLAFAGYDDDELPEFVKTRAFIIPLPRDEAGGKRFISIPMPLGLHVIPNTGRVLTELSLNGGKDMGKRTVAAIGEIAGAFNPLGGGNIFTADGALKTLAPTLIDPVIEIQANRNFAGNRIEKESPRGESDNRPGYQRAKEATQRSTTGQGYLGISKAINDLTGGTPYEKGMASPSPEMIRYLAQTVGGGVLRELEKSVDSSVRAINGEKVKTTGIPALGRFYGEVDDDQVQMSRYYDQASKINKLQSSLSAAKKAGDGEAVKRMYKENPELKMAQAQDEIQAALSKLNKLAVTTVNDPEGIKAVDQKRVQAMRALNEAIREQEKAASPPTLGQRLRGVVKREDVALAP